MRLPRAAVLAFLVAFAPLSTVRAQSDPLQDANQLFRQGELDRAMERVNSYLVSRPKDARGRFLKGLILTEQKKPTDAIKVFSELSQDYPELPEPYNNLAVLYDSQGAYDKARDALEAAIRTHPSYATAHENLGDIYAKMARQAYDKALQLDRSNQAAQSKLNLIKDLFSPDTRSPTRLAAVKPETATANPSPTQSAAPAPSTPAAPTPPTSAAAVPPSPSTFASAASALSSPPPASSPSAPANAPASAPSSAPAAAPGKASTSTPVTPAQPAAPSKSTAATAPEPATAASKPPAADPKADVPSLQGNDEVLRSVNAWAKAWSSNDVRGYLSSYAPDFQTPHKMARGAWEAERKTRIAKPRKIDVEVSSPKVTFEGRNRAVVNFKQSYRSGGLNVSGNKTLVMVKNGDKWQIQQERAGS